MQPARAAAKRSRELAGRRRLAGHAAHDGDDLLLAAILAQHRLDRDADGMMIGVSLRLEPPRRKNVPQRADELGLAERLRDMLDGAGLDRALDRIARDVAGERDDRHLALLQD